MGLFGLGKKLSKPLRLMAETQNDLHVLVPFVQDAALLGGDIGYDTQGRHLTLTMSRFCHEIDGAQALRAPSVLRINGVTSLKRRSDSQITPKAALSLLDISVEPLDEPACILVLRFAGDSRNDIRLEVECIDLLLLDLAAPRRAKMAPNHPLS